MSMKSISKKIVSKAKKLLPVELEVEYPPKIRARYKIRDRLDGMPSGVRAMEGKRRLPGHVREAERRSK